MKAIILSSLLAVFLPLLSLTQAEYVPTTVVFSCVTKLGPTFKPTPTTTTSRATIFQTLKTTITVTPTTTIYLSATSQAATAVITMTIDNAVGTLTVFTATSSTPAGFLPLATLLSNKSHSYAGQAREPPILSNTPRSAVTTIQIQQNTVIISPASYPTSVFCKELIKQRSYTSTITRTASITITISVLPSIIPTTTLLSTSTATNTIFANTASAVAYPGCQSDNLISRIGDNSIDGAFAVAPMRMSISRTQVASECCKICFDTAGCAGSAFYQGACYLWSVPEPEGVTCDPTTARINFLYDSGPTGFTISNGPCGRYGIA